jgi:hypothetical protein
VKSVAPLTLAFAASRKRRLPLATTGHSFRMDLWAH